MSEKFEYLNWSSKGGRGEMSERGNGTEWE